MQIFEGHNFADHQNLDFCGFIFRNNLLSALVLLMHYDCFKNIKDLIFMDDDKLSMKAGKIVSLSVYGIFCYQFVYIFT